MEDLIFLKLGGSLITDKTQAHTPRLEVLARLAYEIAASRQSDPALKLLIGHGSGSFGHIPADRYGTRRGVHTSEEWLGFVKVWQEAAALDHIVVEALSSAGIPVVAFPASASLTAEDGKVKSWNLTPISSALQAGLVPIIYGDVIFDRVRGGTILSTEELFIYLADNLQPQRVLLAGLEAGVWVDFPQRKRFVPHINPQNMPTIRQALGMSSAVDVTGGMESKVVQMLELVKRNPGLEVVIFSGDKPGNVQRLLGREEIGTRIGN